MYLLDFFDVYKITFLPKLYIKVPFTLDLYFSSKET